MQCGGWQRRLLATTSSFGLATAGLLVMTQLGHAAGARGISFPPPPPPTSNPFTITGTISAFAATAGPPQLITASHFSAAGADALLISSSTFTGGVLNKGTLTALTTIPNTLDLGNSSTAASSDGVTLSGVARGIAFDLTNSIAGGIDNLGTMSATASITAGIDFVNGVGNHVAAAASATSLSLDTPSFSGGITNAGLLSATAIDTPTSSGSVAGNTVVATALAQAIYVTGAGSASFKNGIFNLGSGVIEAAATVNAATGIAQARGIAIRGEAFSGGVSNAGTIRASAQGHAATATGIRLDSLLSFAGGIVNSGSIGATAAGAAALAFGIRVAAGPGPGTITNTGMISASGSTGSAAIDLRNATTSTIIDQKAGAIDGNIDFSVHADRLVATGGTIDGSIVGNPGTSSYATDAQIVTFDGTVTFGCPALAAAGCASITGVQSVTLSGGSLTLTPSVRLSSIGTFSQSAGSTLIVEVYAPGVASAGSVAPSLSANSVKLGGAFEVDPLASPSAIAASQYQNTDVYANILVATTSDSDRLGSVTSNTPLLTPKLTDKSGHYTLTLTRVPFGQVAGLTAAQRSFGNSLEALYDKNQDLAAIDPLFAMNAQQYRTYLGTASKPASVKTQNQAIQATQSFQGTIENRLQSFGAYDGTGFTLGLVTDRASDGGGAKGRWGLWSQSFGLASDGMIGLGGAGFSQTAGGIVGYDAKINSRLVVGVAADIARPSWDLDQSIGNSSQGQYQLAGYGRYAMGSWYLSGTAGAGRADYAGAGGASLSGPIGVQGRLDASDMSASAEIGYDIKQTGLTLTPLAGLGYMRWHLDGVTESGAGAADLRTSPSDAAALTSSVGGRVVTAFDLAGARFASTLKVLWQHGLANDSGVVTEQFANLAGGAVGFAQPGAPLPRDSAVIGLGLTGALSASTKLFVDYDGTINRTYPNHSVSAGFRASF